MMTGWPYQEKNELFACWVNFFVTFLSSADFLIFFFKFFQEHIQSVKPF